MYNITIQIVSDKNLVPKKTALKKWAQQTLQKNIDAAEITIRIVDREEMQSLNSHYRNKTGPTNVLSFPLLAHEEIDIHPPLLGDIVICAEVVNQEAVDQHKPHEAHWAHMVIHGIYHLLGYDHETDAEANLMEANEISMMKLLGFANPYVSGEHLTHE